MDKITTVTGIAAPLKRSNVDTDQIIPAVYLKRVTKTGFEDALFSGWRQDGPPRGGAFGPVDVARTCAPFSLVRRWRPEL